MASTVERGGARTRWVRRRRGWRVPAVWIRRAAVATALLVALIGSALFVRHWRNAPDPAAARSHVADSVQLYRTGAISAARAEASEAVRNDPDWGLAHALLGRLYLASGEGATAQAQLDRAVATGFDPARLHHLYAEAALLDGDADRAITEVRRALPHYAAYATRVTALAVAANGDLPRGRAILETLLDSSPDDAAGWADLARLRRQSGDVAGAIGAVDRALSLTRHDARALTLKGELVRDQYGLAAGIPWFDAALAVDPGNADTLLDKAATLGDLGRYRAMLGATRQVLAARPGDPMACYLQAVLAARAGKDDLARDLLAKTDGVLDDMPGALLLGGILDYRNGADQQAIDKWRELIASQPYNLTALRLLGTASLDAGDADGALDVLRPLALRGDADAFTLTLVARAFEAEGKRDWAARFLDRAADPLRHAPAPFGTDDDLSSLAATADAAPGDPVAALGYIRGLIETGRLGTALARAQALAQASPGSPDAQLLLGDTLWAMNRLDDATAAYRRAANLRFDQPTMLRLVDALDRIGDRAAAQQALALYLSQNPEDVPARRLAAHWQLAAGDWAAAIDTLQGLRRTLGDRDAAILGELALAYAGEGKAETARRYGAAAYRLAPMNPAVVDAYGWALAKAGARDGARQVLVKAASLAPDDATIRAHLATVSTND